MSHKVISVIGYANLCSLPQTESQILYNIAYSAGMALVDHGYMIANGGFGGVMEAASKGARDSKQYNNHSIIGILPNYDKTKANSYIDIALPIGFDLARNLSVASVGDAIVVIGGGSGTLSEMAFAWQLNKLIIVLGDYGIGATFKGKPLDSRRNDIIYFAQDTNTLLSLLSEKLPYYTKSFQGIQNTYTKEYAITIIQDHCNMHGDLEFLGKGSEGFVFRDEHKVYKFFHSQDKARLDKLYFQLETLADKLEKSANQFLPPFKVQYRDNVLIVIYDYFSSSDFDCAPEDAFLDLLSDFYYSGIVHCDMQPKNLRITKQKTLFVCDVGYDMVHFSEKLFESMCRRSFAIYKLQEHLASIDNIKTFLSPLNASEDFTRLEQFLQCKDLLAEYKRFRFKVGAFRLHQRLVIDFYTAKSDITSIFDYGAGSCKIAFALKQHNKSVVAYDIDKQVMKEQYYSVLDGHCSGVESLQEYLRIGRKFDSVLCSLVLCHELAKKDVQALDIIHGIMRNLIALSKQHILIVICNPLFVHAASRIQERSCNHLPYSQAQKITKKMYSTNRERCDYHRPIGFYEKLFATFGLHIRSIFQSGDLSNSHYRINNSDFLFFDLIKDNNEK